MSDKSRINYPITAEISPEVLDAEVQKLDSLKKKPFIPKFWGYLKISGPGWL